MDIKQFLEKILVDYYLDSNECMNFLQEPRFRDSIYQELHHSFNPIYGKLLRKLLNIEMEQRKLDIHEDYYEDYFENFYWCAFLIFRLKDIRDVDILWEAKNIDFDTFCMFDIQILAMDGIDKTIKYLSEKNDEEAMKALDYILGCKKAGDFDNMEEWYTDKFAYYER